MGSTGGKIVLEVHLMAHGSKNTAYVTGNDSYQVNVQIFVVCTTLVSKDLFLINPIQIFKNFIFSWRHRPNCGH
jgi:hypothetical protein